nr:hypothetical protein [Tanacetum cinerariifolium]
MTKVIKVEFEKLESLKISDVLLTCNTSFEIFNKEFNRMSRMDDDLFTYEVEIAEVTNIPCDLKREDDSKQRMSQESDDDMEYDPSDVKFTEWAFKEFNYLLQIDPDLLIEDIEGFKTYKDYKDDWIYEWNNDVPWRNDGNCNGGNLPGSYIVGNALCNQDFKWYEALKDGKLKEEALKNKAIMEGIIEDKDNKSSNKGWRRWNVYENTNHGHKEREYEMEHEDKERRELFDDHEQPICNIRRFEMIKFSFRQDEVYVTVKENEYNDLTSTSEEACRTYQVIFRMMDERWM